ncbi:hypothetical protein HCN44_008198 [Aphidius gifuensis]|uniref:Odorant-binding protein n=1 Tax=Aphidius gifuensis TaxID=684658 RepID=A0A835CNH5_APHGI|nr:hypothetical protein HCN44_008198 [Aphidius gifuensis]
MSRLFILLTIFYTLIVINSSSVVFLPSPIQINTQPAHNEDIFVDLKIRAGKIIDEIQPIIGNFKEIFDSIYENYKKNITTESMIYLDEIKKFNNSINEVCFEDGFQKMYSDYLDTIDNITICFTQELQKFKERNIPVHKLYQEMANRMDFKCTYFAEVFKGCKDPTVLEIAGMMNILERRKNDMLKKNFTSEINYTRSMFIKCNENSKINLDKSLRVEALETIKCQNLTTIFDKIFMNIYDFFIFNSKNETLKN